MSAVTKALKIAVSGIALSALTLGVANAAVVLKLAHFAESGHPADVAAKQFSEKVSERTGGEVKITIFPANQLGSPNDVLEQNVLGAIDMSLPTQGHLSKYSMKFATVMAPFAFESYDHVYRVLDGPFIKWAASDLEQQGLVYLSNWDWGFRNITNNTRPVNVPSDVVGLKLRTPPEVQLQSAMSALGANVTQLAFNELYMALKQGVVDGQENPLSVIYHNKIYEVQENLAITRHVYNSMVSVISKSSWGKLSPDQQVIVREESKAAGDLMRKMMREEEGELIKKLEAKGMKITYPEQAQFKAEMAPAYKAIGEYVGTENLEKFLGML
ncbi:TRAP transporter substrate-binding protein [Pseudovibrio sp. Tun.PSC04-5.I4]|uniref:TRAP transporter substrate-binding protein n=1 Tax=Pseudovibrio sp. Tun.PSC04-5.I4 TaxID=1798213 RepID=UPI000891FA7D|nr:TRAP transporter substrate-binding protein [Pseudovibrio sp. Tun.PSC04-5.I4]SDR48761.1 tripartite ATP-independent transporter solute receptor, DctP family [Pseudovibrio sp. Tun.PSC04-5.I4]